MLGSSSPSSVRGVALSRRFFLPLFAVAAAACAFAGAEKVLAAEAAAFQAAPPRVYVAKVKNVLLGLPPTEAEVKAVEADPSKLGPLVDGWMARPEYKEKMMRFFQLAFQQTQIVANDFAPQVYGLLGRNSSSTPLLLQNTQESFARTMVELTSQGHPLTEAMTTRQLMMTTALKELYAFLDTHQIDNEGNVDDAFHKAFRAVPMVVGAAQGPIPIEQSVDPQSPQFMHWYDPDVATEEKIAECRQDPILLRPSALGLHWLLLGSTGPRRLRTGFVCPGFDGTARGPQLTANDYRDWTMVTLRPPNAGETTTTFYDLPALRAARELVLSVPRLGYFSTPAFFANWPTNVANQMRVTINQTLIVATGAAFDLGDRTLPPGTPGLDAAHAGEPECFSCHKVLDPTRSILAATWSWNYHRQVDEKRLAEPGVFAFRDVILPVRNVDDFGEILAHHPLVAPGWVQKLCHYVNSAPCDESDPEFLRIAALFRDSGYSWGALLKAHVTSPLTTFAADTETRRKNGEVVAVSRRNHLCAALDARLGFTDICGLQGSNEEAVGKLPDIVSGLPSDAYGRGAVAPILPNEPTLFFAAGVRNICEGVAAEVVDPAREAPAGSVRKRWSSTKPDAAIADFVSDVMALTPSDPRSDKARRLLKSHFQAALKQPGTDATQALRSAFVVACQAPSAVSVGL
jgi:hypothetical protein